MKFITILKIISLSSCYNDEINKKYHTICQTGTSDFYAIKASLTLNLLAWENSSNINKSTKI